MKLTEIERLRKDLERWIKWLEEEHTFLNHGKKHSFNALVLASRIQKLLDDHKSLRERLDFVEEQLTEAVMADLGSVAAKEIRREEDNNLINYLNYMAGLDGDTGDSTYEYFCDHCGWSISTNEYMDTCPDCGNDIVSD